MVTDYALDVIARRIAGDIVWSDNQGSALRKWREIFQVSQSQISSVMRVSPSVISDYEKNRRRPGSLFIKRFVRGLLEIDRKRGWPVVRQLIKSAKLSLEAIIDMRELYRPVKIPELIKAVKGLLLTPSDYGKAIYGYTVIDSIMAIELLSGNEFFQIMGLTSERALVFTRVERGRSPMVAVKVSPIKPAAVVLHGPKNVDPLAIRLAEREHVPLILSLHESVKELVEGLRSLA